MRSNDIWYGFCNDQYQFSSLQQMIADRLSMDVGMVLSSCTQHAFI